MLYCDTIDISESIDPTKSNTNRECVICQYWFFNHGFKFQDYACNGCPDLAMLSVNISDIVIITVKIFNFLIIVVLFVTLANLKQLIY